MDRLLQFLLKTFIRRGTFRVTTSRGTVFTFGDGTGQPVSVRFATRAAEWGILLDPELKFGESYMDGTLRGRARHRSPTCSPSVSARTPTFRIGRWLQAWLRYLIAAQPIQSAHSARAATWRIITISTDGFIRCSSMPTGNTAAPISSSPISRSTTRNWPRSGISPPRCACYLPISACSTSAAAGAGWACIWPRSPAPT